MDILRENIGILILEGADHSGVLGKIAKKREMIDTSYSPYYFSDRFLRPNTIGNLSAERITLQTRLNLLQKLNDTKNPELRQKYKDELKELRNKRLLAKGIHVSKPSSDNHNISRPVPIKPSSDNHSDKDNLHQKISSNSSQGINPTSNNSNYRKVGLSLAAGLAGILAYKKFKNKKMSFLDKIKRNFKR